MSSLEELDGSLKEAKKLDVTPRLIWQFAARQLRVWAFDEDMDKSVRPWALLLMELYPRGAVITNRLASPVSSSPSAVQVLKLLLQTMLRPEEGERRQRPQKVAFVDKLLFEFCSKPLRSIGIEVEILSLADGVEDYVKTFSNKLIERGRASRGDAADRPGIHRVPGVDVGILRQLFDAADIVRDVKPWEHIDEHLALEVEWLQTGVKRYVTVLGSSKRTYGVAVMDNLASLRRKFARASGTYDPEKDIRVGMLCANCGKEPVGNRTYRCSGCHKVFYCDKGCQKADWPQHQKECGDDEALSQITRKVWMKREQVVVFLDPTAVPFEDLEFAQDNKLWDVNNESFFPLTFVSVVDQTKAEAQPRADRPTRNELEWLISLLRASSSISAEEITSGDGATTEDGDLRIAVVENLEELKPKQTAADDRSKTARAPVQTGH